jgi:hypothetical protein
MEKPARDCGGWESKKQRKKLHCFLRFFRHCPAEGWRDCERSEAISVQTVKSHRQANPIYREIASG